MHRPVFNSYMISSLQASLTAYENYINSSFLVLIGLASILYVWIMEDKKHIRFILAIVPTAVIAVFFFPVFSFVASGYFLEDGIYYRILWLIPLGVITAYTFARVISRLGAIKKRYITMAILGFMIIVSGKMVYLNPLMSLSQNPWQLPESVVDAAKVMHVDGRDVKAVVPSEMVQFIRLYDPSIQLAYGREQLVEGWGNSVLFDAIESHYIPSYTLTDESKKLGVEYIIIRKNSTVVGSHPIDEYEFSFLADIGSYDIYIFDRSEFFEEKMDYYLPLQDPERQSNYIQGESGPNSEFVYIPEVTF